MQHSFSCRHNAHTQFTKDDKPNDRCEIRGIFILKNIYKSSGRGERVKRAHTLCERRYAATLVRLDRQIGSHRMRATETER